MLNTPFTELVGCRVPIQLAGMGGLGTPELAAAVASAGGLGMVSLVLTPVEQVAAELDRAATLTGGRIGINFLMPFLDESVLEVAAEKCCLVELFYGDPVSSLVDRIHRGGSLACWQVGSVTEAKAAADAGCDLIVAQGCEAGGHVRGDMALLPLLEACLDAVDLPIVAAGGIATARGVRTVLAAGACAARVGTRFVACNESIAHDDYVQALLAAQSDDTVITEAFGFGWPNATHRVLRACVQAAVSLDADVVAETIIDGVAVPLPRFIPSPPTGDMTGHIEAMAMYAGQGVGMVRKVEAAAVVVADLVSEL